MGRHVAIVRVEERGTQEGTEHGRWAEGRAVVVARWWRWSGDEEPLSLQTYRNWWRGPGGVRDRFADSQRRD